MSKRTRRSRGGSCPYATGGARSARNKRYKRNKKQRGGFGLDATVLSTAMVPISLVLANQYWPGTIKGTRTRGRKSRRTR